MIVTAGPSMGLGADRRDLHTRPGDCHLMLSVGCDHFNVYEWQLDQKGAW